MRIFFGRIKFTEDNQQIKGAYYETYSPMKLGELKEGDYAFMIFGKTIHLWKAKERIDIDGKSRMNFEVIYNDLPMNAQKFAAFKYFQLQSSLIVLSIRRSPKAFYPIHVADTAFTEDVLLDRSIYDNDENFREIIVLPSETGIDKNSSDIQLYFDGNEHLNIVKAPFFDQNLFSSFTDNLSKEGLGRKMKDIVLNKIKKGKETRTVYSYDQLPILRMYDALFNEYGTPDEAETVPTDDETIPEDRSVQSEELKSFNQIYYGPPGTGKTYLVLKNFCVEEEITEKLQNRIKVDTTRNFWHLAPGRNGYLWEQLKNGNSLGYEWVNKSWGDLNELSPKDIENEGWGNYQLISYLRYVEKGDYICVISGRRLMGIAEVLEDYQYDRAIQSDFDFQTVPVKWLKQFDPPVYLNSYQTKTFVRLNHGTRWGSLLTLLRENGFYFDDEEMADNKMVKPKNFSFVTFHQSFSYEDFIEGIKPVLADLEDEEDSEKLQYEMVSGIFYEACEKAAQLAGYETLQHCLLDTKQNRQRKLGKGLQEYYLIIDELNRGNVASIFGELITLIEDDKRLGASSEIISTLPYSKRLFGVPANLRIIGTMNTADRSIEALDTALRRRFSFEEVIPVPDLLETNVEGLNIDLSELLRTINDRLEKLLNRDYTIGHTFFMNIKDTKALKQAFANKIIPLLQEYFYNDFAKIGLIIGPSFLEIKKSKAVFMKVDQYDLSDIEDKTVYALKKLDDVSDDAFLEMVRKIYGK